MVCRTAHIGTARTWRGFARARVRATTPIGRLVTIRPLPIRTVASRNRVHERTSQAARYPGPPAADSHHQQRLQDHFPCTRLTNDMEDGERNTPWHQVCERVAATLSCPHS